jgi:iron complex outermembrane receptor protein
VQDEPIRVEVITREEIEEKLLMRPGNIAMLVNETGGVRVQVTSPALGAANIRVQGMEGRYTQLLADGLPLYGGPGLVTWNPADPAYRPRQVRSNQGRCIGPLRSFRTGRRHQPRVAPAQREFEGEVLANATTRNGQDLTAYLASPTGGGWSASSSAARIGRASTISIGTAGPISPSYERFTARPRLFWQGADGAAAFVTIGRP